MVKHFDINTKGRDFVAGDIHGCFHLLKAALEAYEFDPNSDRCFAVGDIINRGPYSSQALEWLNQPWFHSCLGNHEDMLLRSAHQRDHGQRWLMANGGEWWLNTTPDTRHHFLHALANLPAAMEVKTLGGTVGIVHADVPEGMSWKKFTRYLSLGDAECEKTALWSRRRAQGSIDSPVPDIDYVTCGHSISGCGEIRVVGNVWFIDTGGYLQDGVSGLTVLPLDALFEE